MLQIGWAVRDITPDRPAMLHGQMYRRVAKSAMDPLLVTALNPLIGYEAGAAIAKEAYASGAPILEVAARPAAARELVHRPCEQRGADAAWRAEAAALMGEEMGEIAGDAENVAGLIENYEGAASGQILECQLSFELTFRDKRA